MQEGWETICAGAECFVYSPAEKCKKTTNPMSDNMPIDDEERFFHQLFVDYYPSLCTFACGYLGNEDAAQDVVQDVFVKLWETRERWKAVEDFSAYLYQMVKYRCFNYLRAERLRDKAMASFAEEVEVTEVNRYIEEETYRLLRNSLGCLPPACRSVFELALDGYKAREIAEKLNIAEETVKKQKQIARRILKEKFGRLSLFFLPML